MASPILNVTELWVASTGEILDQSGTSQFHAQNNYANLILVNLEDGVGYDSTTLINFTPQTKSAYTSHWFYMSYQGLVEHEVGGEVRNFAQYAIRVPRVVLQNSNKNGFTVNDVVVKQTYGTNFIGQFATLAELNSENPPTKALDDDNSIAYVIADADKGFYQVELYGTYVWSLMDNVALALESKQYNQFQIQVQAGSANPNDVVSVSAENVTVIMGILNNLQVDIDRIDENIDEIEEDVILLEDRVSTNEDDIDLLEGRATVLETFKDTTVPATYETKVDAATHKLRTTALEGRATNLEIFQSTTVPATYETISNVDLVRNRVDDLETFEDVTVPATYETKVDATTHKQRTTNLESANMFKSITFTALTGTLTFTRFNDTTMSIDLPTELIVSGGEYDEVNQDIILHLVNGDDIVIPLDDLFNGLATQTWTNTQLENYYTKTQLNAGQLDSRYYTETESNALSANKVDKNITAYTNLTAEENKTSARIYVDDNGTPKKMTLGEIYEGANSASGAFVPNGVYQDLTAGYAMKSESGVDIDDKFAELEGEIYTPDTATLRTGVPVTSMPTGTLDGTVDGLSIEGNLLDAPQLVANGDFSDGATGFVVSAGTLAISNQNAIITGDGTNQNVTFSIPTINAIAISLNTQYYFNTNVKSLNNADRIEMIIAYYQDTTYVTETGVIFQDNPINDTWYNWSGSFTSRSKNDYNRARIYIRTYYTNGTMATNSIHQVDFLYWFNQQTLIANKQYSPLYSTTFDLMSDAQIKAQMDLWMQDGTLPDGIKAVENTQIKSVGKNLNYDKLIQGNISTTTGANTASGTAVNARSNYIKIKPSTVYSGSSNVVAHAHGIFYYDINQSFISMEEKFTSTVSFTTPSNAYYVRIRVYNSSGYNIPNILYQLELGSTATAYEPYRESTIEFPATELYRLPNGTKDTIEFRNGQAYYVQRVQRYVLQSEDFRAVFNLDNVQIVELYTLTNQATFNSAAYEGKIYVPTFPNNFVYSAGITTIYGVNDRGSTNRAVLSVPFGTYADLAAAQADLAGTDIYYQLATPITTTITPTGELMAYENGTLYIDGTFTPTVEFDVPVNLSAQVQALVTSADYQAKQIATKADIAQEDWLVPTLVNGWVEYDTGTAPEYYKDTIGRVYIRGEIKSGTTTTGTVIFTLPEGYRPNREVHLVVYSNQGAGSIDIMPNGEVQVDSLSQVRVAFPNANFRAGV